MRPASDRHRARLLSTVRHLPIFVDVAGAPTLVVGGGVVAARKVALLRSAGAIVTVIAPAAEPQVNEQAAQGGIRLVDREFQPSDVAGMRVVIAATGDRAVNLEVARAAREAGILVNVVDDAELSGFILPAIVDRSPLVVAISSSGVAPILATAVRAQLEIFLDHSWGQLARFAQKWRPIIRRSRAGVAGRRKFYEWLLEGPVARAVRAGQTKQANRLIVKALAEPAALPRGFVSLVGAGPGDPGLLTLHALRALQRADVILADKLVGPEIRALARREAEFIDVGKSPGGQGESQARIHELLVLHARRGRQVVRLKGGDPLIFGRGGEEAQCLVQHGIAFEIVPGISAANACAAYAGIPLTHRDHAQTLHLVTAHCARSVDRIDWAGLAHRGQTLAVYMGVATAALVRDRLLAAHVPAATPAAIIENGTLPHQRVVITDLGKLADAVGEHAIESPALLIIGEVATLGRELAWFGTIPGDGFRKTA